MSRLSLAFLGPLQVTLDTQPIRAAAYDKAWALLAYLALAPSCAHARDSLLALLWPEQPEAAARTNLRQALARLRQAIGDQTAQPPYLLIERESLQFNLASDYQLDVGEFAALNAACDTHRHRRTETCRPCAQRHEAALALYRGRFLDQFFLPDSAVFEEWALLTRERLHQQALDGLGQLTNYHEQRGAFDLARYNAERLLALDPWREEAHRHLMRLFVLSGQRSQALVQYQRCRSILAAELGIEPAEETTAYYQRIRAGEFDARLTAGCHPPLAATRPNLPPQPTAFVGREKELAALGDLLANPDCRLITLVGPGGIGKTRLAMQAAGEQSVAFIHGAVFVPLAPLSAAQLMAPAIANALGLSLSSAEAPAAQLLRYLSDQEVLIVLDNFEHLPDGVALLLDILRETAAVTLLVTSREPLKLRAEWVFDVDGLPVPAANDPGQSEVGDAVALFLQRARQARARFELAGAEVPAVAHICRLLGGMPLGIELAAAWVRSLSCVEIMRAIELDLDVLTTQLRDVPDRHQSLRAVFNHSWSLLSAEEQQILPRLAVFRGGFLGEAAVPVANAMPAQLQALVDKSLVQYGSEGRYELHEVVRQYAAEQLAVAGEADATAERHLAYFLALAQRLQLERFGLGARLSVERLAAENDNFRAALEWCRLRKRGMPWLQLAAALWLHWEASGALAEGLYWLEDGLAAAEEPVPGASAGLPPHPAGPDAAQAARAQAFIAAGTLRRRCGDYPQAETHGRLALRLCMEMQDERGIAAAQQLLGRALRDQRRFEQSAPLFEDSLRRWRALDDGEWIALLLGSIAIQHGMQGNEAQAQALAEESLALCRKLGNLWTGAFQLQTLGQIAMRQGHIALAQAQLTESLKLFQDVGFKPGQSNVLENLGQVSRAQGDLAAARAQFEACLVLRRRMGHPRATAQVLEQIEQVARGQGDHAAGDAFGQERRHWLTLAGQNSQTANAAQATFLSTTLSS